MKALPIVGGLLLATTVALAGGISVYPLINEILLPPGTSYSDVIHIANTGDTAVTITAKVMGFMAPEGVPIFLEPSDDNYPYSGRDLLTVEPAQVEVNPGETVDFHYSVRMPKDLEPYGGRYVAAVFRAEPEAGGNAQVVVATQVAALFFLDPGGKAAPHLTLTQPKIYPKVTDPHSVVLEVSVLNDGDLHISSDQIRGFVFVTDEDGYVIDQFQAQTHTILPHNAYIHREVWHAPDNLPNGIYTMHLGMVLFAPDPAHPQYLFISAPIHLEF
jgi:hypothetical protein